MRQIQGWLSVGLIVAALAGCGGDDENTSEGPLDEDYSSSGELQPTRRGPWRVLALGDE